MENCCFMAKSCVPRGMSENNEMVLGRISLTCQAMTEKPLTRLELPSSRHWVLEAIILTAKHLEKIFFLCSKEGKIKNK